MLIHRQKRDRHITGRLHEGSVMPDTTTPDPADINPSQAEGADDDENMEPPIALSDDDPSQAEGAPEDQDVDSPGN